MNIRTEKELFTPTMEGELNDGKEQHRRQQNEERVDICTPTPTVQREGS